MKRAEMRRVALVACAALGMLVGCADGYPTEDGALVLTYGMSTESTVKAMNTIGHHGYLEHRWRYEVDAACRLRVRSRGLEAGEITLHAASPGVSTRVVLGDQGSHMVFAHASGAGWKGGALVLAGANEFDAGQMKWLVDYLASVCRSISERPQ